MGKFIDSQTVENIILFLNTYPKQHKIEKTDYILGCTYNYIH